MTLSNRNEKKKVSSVSTITEDAREQTETSLEMLTPVEEKAIRMLHGLSEEDNRALEFGLGASTEARMKLAMIEKQMIDCLAKGVPEEGRVDERPSPAELLSAWLDDE